MTKNSISWSESYDESQEIPEHARVRFTLESGDIVCFIKSGHLHVRTDGFLVVRPVASNTVSIVAECDRKDNVSKLIEFER